MPYANSYDKQRDTISMHIMNLCLCMEQIHIWTSQMWESLFVDGLTQVLPSIMMVKLVKYP